MNRRRQIPSYRQKSRYAVVTLTDPSRQRKDDLLGQHKSPESRKEYARVIF